MSQPVTLVTMRLADMVMVHPDMNTSHVCDKCGHTVGIYPGGMRVLIEAGERATVLCQVCKPVDISTATPTPEAAAEMRQSVRRT